MATHTQSQLTLRPYQDTDYKAIENAFESYLSVLYQLPTGGGKSVVISKYVEDHKKENILILAHKRRLLTQMKGHMSRIGVKVGLLFSQTEENLESNVVVASIRTAVKSKRLEKLMERNWDRVIIDEARHSRTGSYDIVLDRLRAEHPMYKLLGVDATPYRKDKKRLDKHFQHIVTSSESVASLQEKGFLAKVRVYATPIGEIQEQVKEVANDYQQTELSNYMRQPKYLKYVVDAYEKKGEKRQAIVFAVDKAHAKDLLAEFKKGGFTKIAQIDSDMSSEEIDLAYTGYENKTIDIIINVEMLTEGVDLPETGCIVGARPTKSMVLYLQMAGRGTRPKEDGSDCILIDCCGWTEEFGGVGAERLWSLDPDVDPNDPRKKNRVVGKDKNGKWTTDIAEMEEFTELVEMTPEEYISKVEGGLKAAEKQNATIDEKITKAQDDLADLLHKAALKSLKDKVSPFIAVVRTDRYDSDSLTVEFFHKSRLVEKAEGVKETEAKDKTHIVRMKIKNRELMYAELDSEILSRSWSARFDTQSVKEYREMSAVAGELNRQIMDNKNLMMQILEKYQQVHDLEKSKINLDEFRDLQKKHEEDQWKGQIREQLKNGGAFDFAEGIELTYDNYFKGSSNWKIVGVIVPSGSIVMHHNKIQLKLKKKGRYDYTTSKHGPSEYSTEEKNYIKGEKVWDMLKAGQWK